MLLLIEKYLLDHWSEIEPGKPIPKKLHFLLSGEKAVKNKTAMVFCENGTDPFLIIKIARSEQGGHFLEKEFHALKYAHSKLEKQPVKIQIPKPIAFKTFASNTALIETAIKGESLESQWGRLDEKSWNAAFHTELPKITDHLIELNKYLSPREKTINLSELARRIWDHFRSVYSPNGFEENKFQQIQQSEFLKNHPNIPSVWLHGDFWIGNILQAPNNQLGLIDWEQAQNTGPPFWDLFFFAATATLYSPAGQWGKQPRQGLKNGFSERSPLLKSFNQAIFQMNREIQLPDDTLSALFDLFLFHMATFHYQDYGLQKEQDKIFRELINMNVSLFGNMQKE